MVESSHLQKRKKACKGTDVKQEDSDEIENIFDNDVLKPSLLLEKDRLTYCDS